MLRKESKSFSRAERQLKFSASLFLHAAWLLLAQIPLDLRPVTFSVHKVLNFIHITPTPLSHIHKLGYCIYVSSKISNKHTYTYINGCISTLYICI